MKALGLSKEFGRMEREDSFDAKSQQQRKRDVAVELTFLAALPLKRKQTQSLGNTKSTKLHKGVLWIIQ